MRTKKRVTSVDDMVQQVEHHAKAKPEPLALIPSGCTLWNLATTGTKYGIFKRGTVNNIIGDKDSGKTMGAMTVLATTYYQFGDEFIYKYRDFECAVAFKVRKLFGKAFADVLDLKKIKSGVKSTVEYLYNEIKELGKAGKPFVFVIDSWDAMSTMAELKNDTKQVSKIVKAAQQQVDETKGSYNTEKARAGAKYLGKIQQIVAETGSIIIIISQTRDGFMSGGFGDTRTRSGGKALGFYANIEMWVKKIGKLGKDPKRPIGALSEVTVKRSKVTGKPRKCVFPILYAYGIDSTRASISFLLDEKIFIKKAGGVLKLRGLDGFEGRLMECMEHVESKGLIERLDDLVAQTWDEIEERIRREAIGNRKPKFAKE